VYWSRLQTWLVYPEQKLGIKIGIFWDVLLFKLVDVYQHYGEACTNIVEKPAVSTLW
jgi:hypothetical protein